MLEIHARAKSVLRIWDCLSRLLFLAGVVGVLGMVNPAFADNPLNGSSPRPFYIVGHNPNTIQQVIDDLNAGANALEPDITLAKDWPCGSDPLDDLVNWDSSFPYRPGYCADTHLKDWLDAVHNLAPQYPNLSLIVFDCKSSVATAGYGPLILQAIREHLNTNGVHLDVIISVATFVDGTLFDALTGPNAVMTLNEHEGLMVDSENDPGAVVDWFMNTKHFSGNIGYGNGTAVEGENLYTSMDSAVWERTVSGYPKAIPYVYTINLENSMRAFIDAQEDGIITDDIPLLKSVVDQRHDIRLASRLQQDDIFQAQNEAYGLQIRTMDVANAGTDAFLTFTLTGDLGSSTITIDASKPGRMERGNTDYVTIPSKKLGTLHSISIYNSGSGSGPDWQFGTISIQSFRYGPRCPLNTTDTGNVAAGQTVTLTLNQPLEQFVWSQFPLPAVSTGSISTPWTIVSQAECRIASSGTIFVAPGQYPARLVLSTPGYLKLWESSPAGNGYAHLGAQ